MSRIHRGLRRAIPYGVSAFALSMAVSATNAQAQQAPAQTDSGAVLEEIVVTGFRASLANSLNIKRNEAGVVDAISAEDIADFPDTNLAESIQRIPGVSIDRDAGEGRSLTVRGLSSEFTRTRINGIEAQATTGATDSSGGTNRGRGFDFNVFASELFNNITVRKTASAEVEEGSLGATVDLKTSRPFDFNGFTAAASAQAGYNDLSEKVDPRGAVLLSNTWLDDQVGALLSVAYSERDLLEEGFSSVRWGPANGDNGFQNPSSLPGGASSAGGVFHPRIPRYGRLVHSQERTGATLSLQAKPNEGNTTVSFDVLYSKLDSTRQENFLEAWSLSRNASQGGKPGVSIVQSEVDSQTGEMLYAVFNGMDIRSEQRFDVLKTEFTQYTLDVDHEFSETVRANLTGGRAKSNFDNPVQTTVLMDRQDISGYSWDFRENSNLPLIKYGTWDVTNPGTWILTGPTGAQPRSEIRMNPTFQTNTYDTAQGNLAWDINDTFSAKGGVNWKRFKSEAQAFARPASTSNAGPGLPTGTTMASMTKLLTGFGKGLNLPEGSVTSWLVPDLAAFEKLFNINCNCDTGVAGGDFRSLGLENSATLANWRNVKEESLGFWAQVDWNTDIGDMPFRGNVGVRQVKTDVTATGYSFINNATRPVTGKNSYKDTLPSINMSLEPVDDVILRAAAAKVLSRPPVTNLTPVFTLTALNAPNPAASLGNVTLEPYRADTVDLSLEWYFAPESLISFAYFYKDISTFVQTTQQTLTYAQLTAMNAEAFPAGGGRDPNLTYVFSTPTNTPGGPLKGFEVSFQAPFSFLPEGLDNLGVQANYTHVSSKIDYCSTSACSAYVTANLVNLSPDAWNGTLYYDDGEKFNARVSVAYRSGYYQQVPAANAGTRGIVAIGKAATTTFDASASYNVTENFTVSFEALNLTDEANRQYHGELDGVRNSTYVYHHTGRQFYLGARYKM